MPFITFPSHKLQTVAHIVDDRPDGKGKKEVLSLYRLYQSRNWSKSFTNPQVTDEAKIPSYFKIKISNFETCLLMCP
jgi:hypothetical protein